MIKCSCVEQIGADININVDYFIEKYSANTISSRAQRLIERQVAMSLNPVAEKKYEKKKTYEHKICIFCNKLHQNFCKIILK